MTTSANLPLETEPPAFDPALSTEDIRDVLDSFTPELWEVAMTGLANAVTKS